MGLKQSAYREECRTCVANRNGECTALSYTSWMMPNYVCSFAKTKEQMEKDAALLKRRIKEGKIDKEKYGY